MKKQDFSKATGADLTKQLDEAHKELQQLLFQVRSNHLKTVRSVRQKRKEIARLKTAIATTTRV